MARHIRRVQPFECENPRAAATGDSRPHGRDAALYVVNEAIGAIAGARRTTDVANALEDGGQVVRIERKHLSPCGQLQCIVDLVLRDRKSTRLNSSHLGISYAVFCL